MKFETKPRTHDENPAVELPKKAYSKPEILFFEELEAIAASCQTKSAQQVCNDPPLS